MQRRDRSHDDTLIERFSIFATIAIFAAILYPAFGPWRYGAASRAGKKGEMPSSGVVSLSDHSTTPSKSVQ